MNALAMILMAGMAVGDGSKKLDLSGEWESRHAKRSKALVYLPIS